MSDVKRPYVAPVRVEGATETPRQVVQAAVTVFYTDGGSHRGGLSVHL